MDRWEGGAEDRPRQQPEHQWQAQHRQARVTPREPRGVRAKPLARRQLVAPACHTGSAADGDDSTVSVSEGADGVPYGAAACFDEVLSTRALECTPGSLECGELECEINWDGGADRCSTVPCVTDDDCEARYGDLCSGEQWVCEAYITGDDRRCNVRDETSGSTGVALCDAVSNTSGCGSEHVDRCTQGWGAQPTDFPQCTSEIDAELRCLESQPIICLRDADVSIGLGSDPNDPWTSPEGLNAFSEFGVLWYIGEPCFALAQQWNDCIYG